MQIEFWQFLGAILSSSILSVIASKLFDKRKNKAETEGIHIDNAINFDKYKDKIIDDLTRRVAALENALEAERENCNNKIATMQCEIDKLTGKLIERN